MLKEDWLLGKPNKLTILEPETAYLITNPGVALEEPAILGICTVPTA